MCTGEKLRDVADRLSCGLLPDATEILEEVIRQERTYNDGGFDVRVVDCTGPRISKGCCDAPFTVNERSGGGKGLTKWYEIELYCPLLFAEYQAIQLDNTQLADILPKSLVDVGPVSIALRAMLKGQRLLEKQADMRARVAWDVIGEFELVEVIAKPLEPGHKYTERHNCTLFYQYLLRFDEDSLENILGRIWETVYHLDLLHKPQAERMTAKSRDQANDLLFELGGLVERLKWKPKLEVAAAHGEMFDPKKASRTSEANRINAEDGKKRYKCIFDIVLTFQRADFLFETSGKLNFTKLAGEVFEAEAFREYRPRMKKRAITTFLTESRSEIRFKEIEKIPLYVGRQL